MRSNSQQIEVFGEEGCEACSEILKLVRAVAPITAKIKEYDIDDEEGAARAAELKIESVPKVVINGEVLTIL